MSEIEEKILIAAVAIAAGLLCTYVWVSFFAVEMKSADADLQRWERSLRRRKADYNRRNAEFEERAKR